MGKRRGNLQGVELIVGRLLRFTRNDGFTELIKPSFGGMALT
jgi:hypothetical protein